MPTRLGSTDPGWFPDGSGRGDDHRTSSPAHGVTRTAHPLPPRDMHWASAAAAALERSGASAAPKVPGTPAVVASATHSFLAQYATTQSLLPLRWHVCRAVCSALLCEP